MIVAWYVGSGHHFGRGARTVFSVDRLYIVSPPSTTRTQTRLGPSGAWHTSITEAESVSVAFFVPVARSRTRKVGDVSATTSCCPATTASGTTPGCLTSCGSIGSVRHSGFSVAPSNAPAWATQAERPSQTRKNPKMSSTASPLIAASTGARVSASHAISPSGVGATAVAGGAA